MLSNEVMIACCVVAVLMYILGRHICHIQHTWVYRKSYQRECVRCGRREQACYVWNYQQKVHFWEVTREGDPGKHRSK